MVKNFFTSLKNKIALGVVLSLLCVAAGVPAFAQSAEIRGAGVYYIDGNTDINDVYCNWGADAITLAGESAYKGAVVNVDNHQSNDPWDTSALIEYDQPYPSSTESNNYPNHCLSLCFDAYCTNKPNGATTYSIAFPLQTIQFQIAKYYGSKDIMNADTNPAVRTINKSLLDNSIVDLNTAGSGTSLSQIVELYRELDEAYAACAALRNNTTNSAYWWKFGTTGTAQQYCPTYEQLIAHVDDNGKILGAGASAWQYCTRSTLAQCTTDWWSYSSPGDFTNYVQAAQNLYDQASTAADVSKYMCAGYSCMGAAASYSGTCTCPNAEFFCNGTEADDICYYLSNPNKVAGTASDVCIRGWDGSGTCSNGSESKCIVMSSAAGRGYNDPVRFCAPWDGSYEILGEFGKTNGQFGFRAYLHTDYPGDGIAIENITIDDSYVYPADNQYPIQVDVTNVHTVRTTPTVVGAITAVQAAPYTIAYRLSKDADVQILVYDASKATSEGTFDMKQVRKLVDWQPRLGEGFKGADADGLVTESEAWDGRDDEGRLLPAGNYVISIQAKSNDEWPGTDYSRQVTRQLSLDPLKLTDITVSGLTKQSTAYAMIHYVPTEASNVYFNIYSPGTTFTSTYTDGSANTGTAPAIANNSGVLVYSNQQQRGRGMSYPDKWDGLCHPATVGGVCTITYPAGAKHPQTGQILTAATSIDFADGAPLPDGDYVYALWAEIPYTDTYTNALGTPFTGVKTQVYYTGIIPVERGQVDITIQPVSYATIGSSPTAYGLDPFIFKYSLAREGVVNAYVKNAAGVKVKTLTNEGGNTNVAQQMNTLTWDGRDDQGRMVGPGTYLFVVEAADPMFPLSKISYASAQFPVDLYRITDVSTTDVYGDSEARATVSYMLSKAMNVQINIYNKDVVIPAQNTTGSTVTSAESSISSDITSDTASGGAMEKLPGLTTGYTIGDSITNSLVADDVAGASYYVYTTPTNATPYVYYRLLKYVTDVTQTTETYQITEVTKFTVTPAVWPPRVCDQQTDSAHFTGGYVDPTTRPTCIYVNDTTFTHYPSNPNEAKYNYAEGAKQTLDVRLQPVKTFNRSALNAGDGIRLTEEWDAQYFYNPTPVSIAAGGKNSPEVIAKCTGTAEKTNCPYEMIPDGTYPLYIAAQTQEPVDLYYNQNTAVPFTTNATPQTGLYATDKPVYRINITRGPVYFLDGSTHVYPNAPQLFNTSSGPVFVPPYEINFAISRAATVEVAVVALEAGLCTTTQSTGTAYGNLPYNNKAGEVCKYLSTMTIPNTANFDPNITRRVYWDGTDNNGKYVRNGNYEFRLTAKNYPDEGLYQPSVKQITQNVDLLKVFDLPDAEAYAINTRGTNVGISYQISVPMKVAVQIFKPGTTIYDYQKGTLRDPATGLPVKNIRDVLVRAIVGIRPSTTLIEEVWDGTDYAQQIVPDGTYPFRFVTALNSADIDSVTGEIVGDYDTTDGQDTDSSAWKIQKVADTNQYVNLHRATVAIGDGQFVCEDWEKTVFFYPNPFKSNTGTLEITKLPVPGKMSIKLYNLAGDLVRTGGYTCVDAQNMQVNMSGSLEINPDNNVSNTAYNGNMPSLRNAALRCFWDKTNDHGKRVARGVYFGLVDFRAQNGRQHCQKVVKILIPK